MVQWAAGHEPVLVEGRIETTTRKAVLVELTMGDEQIWLPFSQIYEQPRRDEDGLTIFTISQWIAGKNDL